MNDLYRAHPVTTRGSETASLVLASASPRREALLRQIGVDFRVVAADIEEKVLPGESPGDFVLRMARAKALAVSTLRNMSNSRSLTLW